MEEQPTADDQSYEEARAVNALFDFVSYAVPLPEEDLLVFGRHEDPKQLIRILAETGITFSQTSEANERYIKICKYADRKTDHSKHSIKGPPAYDKGTFHRNRRPPLSSNEVY
jgi:hypothetical protein